MKLKESYDGDAGEAICDYAALRILGLDRPIAEPKMALGFGLKGGFDQNAEIRESVRILRRSGNARRTL